MKRIVLSIITLMAVLTADAQSISDYFFRDGQVVTLYSGYVPSHKTYRCNGNIITVLNYSVPDTGSQAGQSVLTAMSAYRVDKTYSDIIVKEVEGGSALFGDYRRILNQILLTLPPASWEGCYMLTDPESRKVDYTSTKCYVKVNSELIEAIKVSHEVYFIDKKGREYMYWGKGLGLLAIEIHGEKVLREAVFGYEGEVDVDDVGENKNVSDVPINLGYPPYQIGEGTEGCFQIWTQNQSQYYPMVKGRIMNIYEKPIAAKDIVIKVCYQGSKTPIFVADAVVESRVLNPEEWYSFSAGGLNNGKPININDSGVIYIDVLYRKGTNDYSTLASFMIDPRTSPVYDEKYRQLR